MSWFRLLTMIWLAYLVLLAFSEAFDCLDIELLWATLSYYSTSNETCCWGSSYLPNRSQYAEVDTNHAERLRSDTAYIYRGCPQGSVLRPILFTLFTTDLIKLIEHCKIHLYDDDTHEWTSLSSWKYRLGNRKNKWRLEVYRRMGG